MKKLIIAAAATAIMVMGGSPASAQTNPDPTVLPGVSLPLPIECSERDNGAPDSDGDGIPDVCVDFYIAQVVVPPTTAPATTTTISQETLPKTGSGVSPILGIGAMLFVGGGIIVVATRRRSSATAA